MDIPAAKPSPRFEFGTLCWYEGDIFDVYIEIELVDQDGEQVSYKNGATTVVQFYDEKHTLVQQFGTAIIEGKRMVWLHFNEETTAKFPAGNYTYNVLYSYKDADNARRATLAKENKCLVE